MQTYFSYYLLFEIFPFCLAILETLDNCFPLLDCRLQTRKILVKRWLPLYFVQFFFDHEFLLVISHASASISWISLCTSKVIKTSFRSIVTTRQVSSNFRSRASQKFGWGPFYWAEKVKRALFLPPTSYSPSDSIFIVVCLLLIREPHKIASHFRAILETPQKLTVRLPITDTKTGFRLNSKIKKRNLPLLEFWNH